MSNFKVGDRVEVVSDTYSITRRGSVGIIKRLTDYGFAFISWEKIPNFETSGYTYTDASTWDIYTQHLKLLDERSKQEKLLDKIQYLYKTSPCSFEKRWVK